MKTQIAEVRQSFTGKWLVVIDTYNRTGDRCAFSTESAAVFASSDEAYACTTTIKNIGPCARSILIL